MWARPKKLCGAQEQSDWRRPSGRAEIRLFKTDHHFGTLSLFFALQLTCSLADKPEASASSGRAGSPPSPSGWPAEEPNSSSLKNFNTQSRNNSKQAV